MEKRKKSLTLNEKMDIVNILEKEKLSVRALATRFLIGKSQAADIIKNRDSIRSAWESGINLHQKRTSLRAEGLTIDRSCFEWFSNARRHNIPVSGQLVKAKAKEIAEQLGYHKFRASDGWLQKWRKRHGINFSRLSDTTIRYKTEVDDEESAFIHAQPSVILKEESETIGPLGESGPEDQIINGRLHKERLKVLLSVLMNEFVNSDHNAPSEESVNIIDNLMTEFGSRAEQNNAPELTETANIKSYDDALKLIKELKDFVAGDFIGFQHVRNLERYFLSCNSKQKSSRQTSILDYFQSCSSTNTI